MPKLFNTGIQLCYGMKSIRFRDARNIKVNQRQITFDTAVICIGNNVDTDGCRVYTELNPETYSGLEGIISNPILIRYKEVDPKTTTVTVYLHHLRSYEIIQKE